MANKLSVLKSYFERPDNLCADPSGGRKVTLPELKELSEADKVALATEAAKVLGVTLD